MHDSLRLLVAAVAIFAAGAVAYDDDDGNSQGDNMTGNIVVGCFVGLVFVLAIVIVSIRVRQQKRTAEAEAAGGTELSQLYEEKPNYS
jgi:NADH:ubiquinone oxidoreductase subunit 6 (subunit J)